MRNCRKKRNFKSGNWLLIKLNLARDTTFLLIGEFPEQKMASWSAQVWHISIMAFSEIIHFWKKMPHLDHSDQPTNGRLFASNSCSPSTASLKCPTSRSPSAHFAIMDSETTDAKRRKPTIQSGKESSKQPQMPTTMFRSIDLLLAVAVPKVEVSANCELANFQFPGRKRKLWWHVGLQYSSIWL